jgi:hypothetical protein
MQDFLVEHQIITPKEYEKALKLHQLSPAKDLTDIMLEEGLVTWEALIGCLFKQVEDLR